MTTSTSISIAAEQKQEGYAFSLSVLTILFFIWGFITCLNDILIPHLKAAFELNYAQAMLIQFCFFGAYFIVSLPAGKLLKNIGYQKGIFSGLLITALGCLTFYPAAENHSYPLFLIALFVLASGITILQVSANPYVALLGPNATAPARLTMTQAFNSLGTTIAPYLGALFILNEAVQSLTAPSAESVKLPYLVLMSVLLVLAAIFAFVRLPRIDSAELTEGELITGSAWQHRHLVLGAIAIFVYVGAEVSIGSFLVNFFGEPDIAALEEAEAAKYLTYYWGGAMVGRFVGAAIMHRVNGRIVLIFNAISACFLIVIAILSSGYIAMWALLLIGLCNSVMFPTIFSLALNQLGKHTSQGSSILCLAIVGGAIIPVLQGLLADVIGIQLAFFLPLLCYLYVVYYGVRGSQVDN